ncbi:MAG: ribbon-helix-helix protein, CopG family [Acidimicrobiia bacterium]
MSTKPKPIRWLEEQTGQTIAYPEAAAADSAPHDRHLSVRLPNELALALDALAAERGVKLSHLVRDILTDAVEQRGSVAALDARALADRLAADVAEVRRRLAG